MSHFSYEEWLKYVKGELAEDVQIQYDHHVYGCDTCLELYSEAISHLEDSLPDLQGAHFTDQVMAAIETSVPLHEKDSKVKKSFVQSAWFHYATAAGFTLLLTVSGVFQSMTGFVDKFENTAQAKEETVTETVMNKISWFEDWEEPEKEANQ